MTKQHLGLALKRARMRAGMKQKELAEKLNIWSTYLSSVEHGRVWPSMRILFKYSEALNTRVSTLFGAAEEIELGRMGQIPRPEASLVEACKEEK
jgi:transcriptional regulator with XRE-family HTH domain